jgi:23S rRNA pseudouridine1911/1915/1917 synthase
MSVREGGRVARTAYEVVDTFREPDLARLECRLETGRTHQIRVHLQAIGHPVVGDAAYGGQRRAIALDRPFLHAGGLAFAHPVTGEPIAVEEPLPPELVSLLALLAPGRP